ncbi:hypothetical protein TNCV_815891 [Trichonephila clavipes]|nr:hypothetical protein TNCV_815891 [Trichonephila clavipes]
MNWQPEVAKLMRFPWNELVIGGKVSYDEILPTRGLLVTDLVNLNHGQVTRTTPELAPQLLTSTQTRGRLSLDIFSVDRPPLFTGTRLELMTLRPRDRYLDH